MTTLAELRQANLKEQQPVPVVPETPAPAPQTVAEVPALLPELPALHLTQAEGPSEIQQKGGEMLVRVHNGVAKKQQYSVGAKVSIDMPPALFHRAKKYCNAHGNITLRQVCLELLAAYLDEEGA